MKVEQQARKDKLCEYLESLLKSIEKDDIEVLRFSIAQGIPERDSVLYDIDVKIVAVGFTRPLYELAVR